MGEADPDSIVPISSFSAVMIAAIISTTAVVVPHYQYQVMCKSNCSTSCTLDNEIWSNPDSITASNADRQTHLNHYIMFDHLLMCVRDHYKGLPPTARNIALLHGIRHWVGMA